MFELMHWCLGAMKKVVVLGAVGFGMLMAMLGASFAAGAPQNSYVRFESHASLDAAIDRAFAYATQLPKIAVHEILGGWYAVVMGPFEPSRAQMIEQRLKLRGQIPPKGFLVTAAQLGVQQWPPTAQTVERKIKTLRDLERRLVQSKDGLALSALQIPRMISKNVQSMLRTLDFYQGDIDGIHGGLTQAAIERWQRYHGFRPNGDLSRGQRDIMRLETVLKTRRAEEAVAQIPASSSKANWSGVFINASGDVLTATQGNVRCSFWVIDGFWPAKPRGAASKNGLQILGLERQGYEPRGYAHLGLTSLEKFDSLSLHGFSMGKSDMIAVEESALVSDSTKVNGFARVETKVFNGDHGAPLFDHENRLRAMALVPQGRSVGQLQEISVLDVIGFSLWLRQSGITQDFTPPEGYASPEKAATSVECW